MTVGVMSKTQNGAGPDKNLPCGCPDDESPDKFWDMWFQLSGNPLQIVIRQCNRCGKNLGGSMSESSQEEEPLIVPASSVI